ncbi:unnamed protein product [Paramecium octaurelia]|uniref:Uncharacterized protein n=1 Tax=Paramecium octaurelia TaxID=43137 RepID=A0A8S1XTX8_PAROT|nr:unnamed protein product [Paramecium octaurelia]
MQLLETSFRFYTIINDRTSTRCYAYFQSKQQFLSAIKPFYNSLFNQMNVLSCAQSFEKIYFKTIFRLWYLEIFEDCEIFLICYIKRIQQKNKKKNERRGETWDIVYIEETGSN